jgi:ribonuclease Z
MTRLLFLGTASAIADQNHENSSLAIITPANTILVDCTGSPLPVLNRAQINLDSISDIILTHFHPDHVSGIPLLLLGMWLSGREKSISIFGLEYTITRMQSLMDMYGWRNWPNFYQINYQIIPEGTYQMVLHYPEITIYASPVKHTIPTIGIRGELPEENCSFAYSSDTQPDDAVVELGSRVDFLIHDATGDSIGHSSPGQAGEIAEKAGAGELFLTHYPVYGVNIDDFLNQAREKFSGRVRMAEDLLEVEFNKQFTNQ